MLSVIFNKTLLFVKEKNTHSIKERQFNKGHEPLFNIIKILSLNPNFKHIMVLNILMHHLFESYGYSSFYFYFKESCY